MLLSDPQLDHLNHKNRAWLDHVTERGGIEHVEEQARLECLLDALQPGVAPGEREQLSVEVREGNQAFTGVFGDGHIYFTPEDAAHPAGVRAVAFILAHEMAHTVADHSNKIVSHKLIGELGEDRAKNIVDNRSPYGVEKILLRSESSAEQREFVRGTESEADRGGLHILHRSGVPLDGARDWAADHVGSGLSVAGTHPEPDKRAKAINALADELETRGTQDADPTAQCTDSGLRRGGWLLNTYNRMVQALKPGVPPPAPPPGSLPSDNPRNATSVGSDDSLPAHGLESLGSSMKASQRWASFQPPGTGLAPKSEVAIGPTRSPSARANADYGRER